MRTALNPESAGDGAQTLGYLPVALFGAIMGLSGLANAWRLAQGAFGQPEWISLYLGYIAILSFVAVALGFSIKVYSSFDIVRAEFRHPTVGPLYGTPLISMVLLPIALADINLQMARTLWAVGGIGITLFSILIVNRWLTVRHQVADISPTWIIPVVGIINVPLAVPSLHIELTHGMMMFELAVGLFFAIPLFTLIFARVLLAEAMPAPMQPSLMILIAPFAVGFSSYIITIGHIDQFSEALFMIMIFLLLVLSVKLAKVLCRGPFRLTLWSISFPLSAASTAAIRYASLEHNEYADGIAVLLLALASIVIMGLLIRTLLGIFSGQLRAISN